MASISIKLPDFDAVDRELAELELRLRTGALRKALRAGGNVVKRRAAQLAPRSIETGTRDAWSDATEAERQGVKPLAETMGVVVRDYGLKWVMVVGPQYPAGALGHLVEYGHAEFLWGQPTGRRVGPKPFLRPAADQTEAEVSAKILDTLRRESSK
jgi:hypothetical protein